MKLSAAFRELRRIANINLRAPYASMPDREFMVKGLERALKALGPDDLSERLQVPPELIQTWINGHATMPERKFLRLIDLLGEI